MGLGHEMQREMDAMGRLFGLPSMLGLDPFLSSRPPAMHLAKVQLPSMTVAVGVEEDQQAYTTKADVPGMGSGWERLDLSRSVRRGDYCETKAVSCTLPYRLACIVKLTLAHTGS